MAAYRVFPETDLHRFLLASEQPLAGFLPAVISMWRFSPPHRSSPQTRVCAVQPSDYRFRHEGTRARPILCGVLFRETKSSRLLAIQYSTVLLKNPLASLAQRTAPCSGQSLSPG